LALDNFEKYLRLEGHEIAEKNERFEHTLPTG
jgi:hypothetical protein